MKTFEYRLYPTKAQGKQLLNCLATSRHLYNEMLESLKAHYEATGKFLWKYGLCAAFKGRGGDTIPATTVQTLADRLDKALRRYLAFKVLGKPCGFPRFKSANRWHSIDLRQYGIGRDVYLEADNKHLHVPGKIGKSIKIKLHRPFQGVAKTAHLVLRADGHWYALIVCEMPEREPAQVTEPKPDIGIDVGLRYFLADSEGNTVPNPTFYRTSQATLRRKQRTLSRRQKGSHHRRKAAKSVAQTHLKISRQRRDFLFKTVKAYAESYEHIFVENLSVNGMVQNHHLAKSIYDASWSDFFNILTYKAESAGHQVVKVPPRYTSQKCSGCGELVPKSLAVRTHVCPHCGLIADRDVNAALNILAFGKSAGAPPSEHNGSVGSRAPRSRRP